MINIPYVKEYDENGNTKNPIKGSYLHEFSNRRTRRKEKHPDRFHGESKNYHLTVTKTSKTRRYRQLIKLKTGGVKVIEHYQLLD